MLDNHPITLSVLLIAVIVTAGVILDYLLSDGLRRKVKCLFGFHAPDAVRAAPGGRNVQRCLYCDKIVREYQVTVGQAKNERNTIRRVK